MVRDSDNMPFGVSNSFKRGTMRTYSSRQNRALLDTFVAHEGPRVRISMDENGRVKEETIYPGSTGPIGTSTSAAALASASTTSVPLKAAAAAAPPPPPQPLAAPVNKSTLIHPINTMISSSLASKDKDADAVEPSSPVSRGLFSETSASEQTQLTSASPPSSPPPPSHKQHPQPSKRASSPSSASTTTVTSTMTTTTAAKQSRKLSYSSLKRKRTSSPTKENANPYPSDHPLSETHANTTPARRRNPNGAPPAKRTRLTQMQLDLGRSAQKTCRECGMRYVATSREDSKLHNEFHAMHASGVDMGGGFSRETRTVEDWDFGEVVNVVGRTSPGWVRRKVAKVLGVVDADLGAVGIPEERLWSLRKGSSHSQSEGGEGGESSTDAEERYKVFLYLAGDKCVGLCLAERIRSAARVVSHSIQPHPPSPVPPKDRDMDKIDKDNIIKSDPGTPTAIPGTPTNSTTLTPGIAANANASATPGTGAAPTELRPGVRSSCIRTEPCYDPMLLGISRVWVSRSHRRKGIALTLLDCARTKFFYGIEVPKKMVAFSQPTESGGLLAESWFGERSGWRVYEEGE